MHPAISTIPISIDVGWGGILLDNMLAAWLDGDPKVLPSGEAFDEFQNHGASSEPTSVHLLTTVDAEPSSPPSGEHGTSVCTPREGAGTRLERILIHTLDRDLGKTGAEMAGREDFKTLVAEVSMGQVSAVFALKVSRLARSNLDWHRLLELCALTETLVIDEYGCYDPADFNDGLLLGLKGAMAQAELHFLHARLQGGKLNKARKGELRFPVPVGLCYDEQGRITLDPDEEVRGAVGLVFRLFRETASAFGVMQRFGESALRFPLEFLHSEDRLFWLSAMPSSPQVLPQCDRISI